MPSTLMSEDCLSPTSADILRAVELATGGSRCGKWIVP